MMNPTHTMRPSPSSQNQPLHTPPATAGNAPSPEPALPDAASSGADQTESIFDSQISPAEAAELALSAPQRMAIERMLSGNTMVASAAAAGVTRKTLYNWLHHDAKFQAAYNAWQLDAMTCTRSRMLTMADEAVSTVSVAVKSNPKLAFSLLKSLGVLDRPTPGSTDPDEIQERMDIEERKADSARVEEMFFASIGSGHAKRDGLTTDLIAELRKMKENK